MSAQKSDTYSSVALCAEGASTTDGNDLITIESLLASRIYLYCLFHKCFGGTPTKDLLDLILGETTASVLSLYCDESATLAGLHRLLSEYGDRKDRTELLDKSKDEYTRLFIGPDQLVAIPCESPWRTKERSIVQENSLVVRSLYRQGGYEPKRLLAVPDDHVALEAHFMESLSERALRVFRSRDMTCFADIIRNQQRFITEHLSEWVAQWMVASRKSKTAILYPQLIEAFSAFIEMDLVFVGEVSYWVDQNSEDLGVLDDETKDRKSLALHEQDSKLSEEIASIEAHYEQLRALRLLGIDEFELRSLEEMIA